MDIHGRLRRFVITAHLQWNFANNTADSSAPTWDNMINGQVNLYDAIRKQVDFKQGEKEYKLRTDRVLPTLIARARGWHLEEKHFTVDGEPISGSLFDFGLYFFHNAEELVKRGTGPYFYLEDGIASRGASLERRLLSGTRLHRHAQRNNPRHCLDR